MLYGCRVNNTPGGGGVGTFMDAGSIIHLGGGRDLYGCRVNIIIHLGEGRRDLYECRLNNTPGRGV